MNRIALLAAFGAILGPAVGGEDVEARKPLTVNFIDLDTDKDGKLSRREADAVDDLSLTFATLDTNKDAQLTPVEFSGWARAGHTATAIPKDPATAPTGSAGAQHMPREN